MIKFRSIVVLLLSLIVACGTQPSSLAQQISSCIPLNDDETTSESYFATILFRERETLRIFMESSVSNPQKAILKRMFLWRFSNRKVRLKENIAYRRLQD